jgi:hypothetical protein
MKTRYKLHWASGNGPSPELKWQIWDWSIRHPVVHLGNRALGRQICKLLNDSVRAKQVAAPRTEETP